MAGEELRWCDWACHGGRGGCYDRCGGGEGVRAAGDVDGFGAGCSGMRGRVAITNNEKRRTRQKIAGINPRLWQMFFASELLLLLFFVCPFFWYRGGGADPGTVTSRSSENSVETLLFLHWPASRCANGATVFKVVADSTRRQSPPTR